MSNPLFDQIAGVQFMEDSYPPATVTVTIHHHTLKMFCLILPFLPQIQFINQ